MRSDVPIILEMPNRAKWLEAISLLRGLREEIHTILDKLGEICERIVLTARGLLD